MGWLIRFTSGMRALFQRQRVRRELDEEIAEYLEAAAARNEGLGMSPDAARRAAVVQMGSVTSIRQQVWESHWESILDTLFQDLRLSVRSLLKRPGFTLVALLSLALGIGANVAIFTLVRQVLLQELPVKHPELLVTFGEAERGGIGGGIDIGQFDLFPWYFARHLELDPGPFQGIAAFGSVSDKVILRRAFSTESRDVSSTPTMAAANLVSGNYFQVLGAQAMIGRTITPFDATNPGTAAVVVLSYSCWQRFFASDPAIVGQTVALNNTPFTVIGVMPRSFQGIKIDVEPVALWTPDTMQPVVLRQPSLLTPQSGLYFLHMFGRLAPEAAKNKDAWSRSQDWLNQRIHNAIRDRDGASLSTGRLQEINREVVPLIPAAHGVSSIRSQYGNSLRILMGIVVLILLIACANLANFLLARAAGSQRETATRLALGSSRARIVCQSLIHSSVLSLAGGLLGLVFAFLCTRALIAFISSGSQTVSLNPRPDPGILLFAMILSVLTAILFGLAPALISSRTGRSLSSGFTTRTMQAGRSSRFWPKALVTVQIVFSLVLLIVAGLFIRTLRNLQDQPYGFERSQLVIAQFNPRLAGYRPDQTAALYQRLIDRLHALPGVRSAALAATPPIHSGGWSSLISMSGYTPAPKENMLSMLNRVSGEYFETAGIPIAAGRGITDADSSGRLKVAVVNQTLARHFFPKGDAIGRQVTLEIDSAPGPWQIVGIAQDSRSSNPRDTGPIRMVYVPLAQIEPFLPNPRADSAARGGKPNTAEENQDRFVNVILLRTTGDPKRVTATIQSAVSSVDPNLPLFNVVPIQQQISKFISHDELISTVSIIFSLLALLLASIGLYGVMSYHVQCRRSEIGIRIALGAQVSVVRWMIVRESLLLLAIGLALGIPLALASKQLIQHELFGISAADPITFAAAIFMVGGMTIFASWLPANHASKIDPLVALRAD